MEDDTSCRSAAGGHDDLSTHIRAARAAAELPGPASARPQHFWDACQTWDRIHAEGHSVGVLLLETYDNGSLACVVPLLKRRDLEIKTGLALSTSGCSSLGFVLFPVWLRSRPSVAFVKYFEDLGTISFEPQLMEMKPNDIVLVPYVANMH